MEIKKLFADQITVKERQRIDFEGIKQLSKSIKEKGQLQPILITRDYVLIAGERRLRACKLAGIPVICSIYQQDVSKVERLGLEIIENLVRKAFTPTEEITAITEFHELQQKTQTSWKQQDTAKALNTSPSTVANALKYCSGLDLLSLEKVNSLKTLKDIRKACGGIESGFKTAKRIYQGKKVSNPKVNIACAKMQEYIKTIPDNTIDLILTDPPYGISIEKSKEGSSSVAAGLSFEDSYASFENVAQVLSTEGYRVMYENSVMFCFCAPEFFWVFKNMLETSGNKWKVYPKPLIWHKPNTGQTNFPERHPASCYETILYAWKGSPVLSTQGGRDLLKYSAVTGDKKHHINAKPKGLAEELQLRYYEPHFKVFDGCLGSGALLRPAVELGLEVYGCETDKLIFKLAEVELNAEVVPKTETEKI